MGDARGSAARERGGKGARMAMLGCAAALALPVAAPAQGTGGSAPAARPAPRPAPPTAPARPVARLGSSRSRACAAAARPARRSPARCCASAARRCAAPPRWTSPGCPATRTTWRPRPAGRGKTFVDVRVPLGAVTGPMTVVDRDGVASAPAPAPLTVEVPAPSGGGPSIDVDVLAPRAYFDARRPMRASYVVHDDRPVNVRIELVRASTGAVVASWTPGLVQPETPQIVEWDGRAGGRVQKPGRYAFRVSAADEAGALRASSAQLPEPQPAQDPSSFTFARHQFPIRGPHGYGESAARFGGGRGHQGHDVMAACGTPLVAARGGTVKVKQYHSRGGLLPGDRRRADLDRLHVHAPRAARAGGQGRARPHRPADRLRRQHRLHQRRATCTSRCGRHRAGTAAARRSTRCPTCSPGTGAPSSPAKVSPGSRGPVGGSKH